MVGHNSQLEFWRFRSNPETLGFRRIPGSSRDVSVALALAPISSRKPLNLPKGAAISAMADKCCHHNIYSLAIAVKRGEKRDYLEDVYSRTLEGHRRRVLVYDDGGSGADRLV